MMRQDNGRIVTFSGFIAADFNAYEQPKWSSNVFNIERLQVRQKLKDLGKDIGGRLSASDGSLLTPEVTPEHPAVWNHHCVERQILSFSRNDVARRELQSINERGRSIASLLQAPSGLRDHISLTVTVDEAGVTLGLNLHPEAAVDRSNLSRKCNDYLQRERLIALFQDLPEGFSVHLADNQHTTAAIDDQLVQDMSAALTADTSSLTLRHFIAKESAIAAGAAFGEQVQGLLASLLPLLHFCGWSRENDHVSIKEQLREQGAKNRSKGVKAKDRIRVVKGVFAGKTGTVESVDPKGAVKVRLGKMVMKLAGDDIAKQ